MEISKTISEKIIKIVISGEELNFDVRNLKEIVNPAGIKMWQYKYWLIETDKDRYKITDPVEYRNLFKAVSNPVNFFVKIHRDVINIKEIKSIKEKVGYKEQNQEPEKKEEIK